MKGYYIGMDVGGTHLRLKLADACHRVLEECSAPGCSLNLSGYQELKQQYGAVIRRALDKHGYTPAGCMGLCIGAAGVDSDLLRERYMEAVQELGFDRDCVRIYNDCEIFLHLPEGPNIVAVAGTGSITVGMDSGGKIFRCGGWGHLLSDDGSSFFIVKRAMEEIIHHLDGIAYCPRLTEEFTAGTGLRTQHELAMYFYEHIGEKREIARFAPIVSSAAEAGDPAAAGIIDEAAQRLWGCIRTVAQRICPCENFPMLIQLWGSVFLNSRQIHDKVTEEIFLAYPNASVTYPEKSALDTALDIAFSQGGKQPSARSGNGGVKGCVVENAVS